MLDKPLIPGLPPKQQPQYQHVTDCTYWPVLGSFNNWNIIILSHKATTSESFEDIHQIFLNDTSNNIASLVQSGKYGTTNTTKSTTMG